MKPAASRPFSVRPTRLRGSAVGVALLAVVLPLSLALMGRVWWCQAGDLWPWSWNVWSQHNSQHLVDPYSLSHLQHGIGLYLLLTALGSCRVDVGRILTAERRTLCVAVVEASWELLENTDWMIERYRATTMSLGYTGDSIANSLGDYGACLMGVWLARHLPWRLALGLFVLLELISVAWIRDSLLLNILMLVYPLDAIRSWQMGAA